MHMRQQHDLIELRAKIEQLRAALMEARDAWQEQLDRDEEAAGDDEISQPMLQETRELIARCNAALGQSVSE
jgi:predicted secreted Zn-dependent protease